MRHVFAAVLAAAIWSAASAEAQTFPVTRGTLEIQVGMAGLTLPEDVDGTYSAQPEFRVGFFFAEGLQLQAEANARIWPLGTTAPHAAGVGGHLAWFPNLGAQSRNLYLMAGAGLTRVNPLHTGGTGTSIDPLFRGGLGYKVPVVRSGPLGGTHITVEYRVELQFLDATDLVSGGLVAASYFL